MFQKRELMLILLQLLKSLSSPFTLNLNARDIIFSHELYRLALRNKVVLSYLSRCIFLDSNARRFYTYYRWRYENLLEILCKACNVLEEHGFRYAVFKTLRPFDEDVADIDIISLSDDLSEYNELVRALSDFGYVVMEKSFYCTTFMDINYRYIVELMIDAYREVSAGPFIYLNKKLFLDHIVVKDIKEGCKVKILDPVAESLVTIAHSLIKEMKVRMLDYLTILYLSYKMNKDSMVDFIDLVKRAKLVYGTRLFLSIVLYLHKMAHGFVPDKIVKLLEMLGGNMDVHNIIMNNKSPYRLNYPLLTRIYIEKIRDPVFRHSIAKGLKWISSKKSIARLTRAIIHKY